MDASPATLQAQFFLRTALGLSAAVILIYDHIITFDDEYCKIWTRPRCRASAIFMLTRYIAFLVIPTMIYADFPSINAPMHIVIYRQIAVGIIELIVAINQFLRVYALYRFDRRIAAVVVFTAAVVGAICIWSIAVQKENNATVGCHQMISDEAAHHLAIAWAAFFAYDLIIFGLMLTKTAKVRAQLAQVERRSLITIVYRDGVMYFAVMLCAQCANIITFLALPPALRGAPSTLASSISVTMMIRCILNLHERDAPLLGMTAVTAEEFDTCPAPMTAVSDYFDGEPQAGTSRGED